MNILVTGAAGFIGSHVVQRLLNRGDKVVGVDNINDYYSPTLKIDRLKHILNLDHDNYEWNTVYSSGDNFSFVRLNLEDAEALEKVMNMMPHFDAVVNLAAQVGVRYSITNPLAYIHSNIDGFINILEACRNHSVGHLVFASSSSVYGLNGKTPYSEHDSIAHPVSLYAATKKANELMAHSYSHLYNIPCTGLRFFTVYGPWGRPDMAPALFTGAILRNEPIKVFNNGNMFRDFTYVDDIVEGIIRVIDKPAKPNPDWDNLNPDPATSSAPYRVFNIGNSQPIKLMDFISAIENEIGREAIKEFMPMQPGDVLGTFSDSSALYQNFNFKPSHGLADGIKKTVSWFKAYYNL